MSSSTIRARWRGRRRTRCLTFYEHLKAHEKQAKTMTLPRAGRVEKAGNKIDEGRSRFGQRRGERCMMSLLLCLLLPCDFQLLSAIAERCGPIMRRTGEEERETGRRLSRQVTCVKTSLPPSPPPRDEICVQPTCCRAAG